MQSGGAPGLLDERGASGSWKLITVLLLIALGSEFTDENPLPIFPILPWPRFMAVVALMGMICCTLILARRLQPGMPRGAGPALVAWLAAQFSIIGIMLVGTGGEPLLYFLRTDIHFTIYIVFTLLFLKLASRPNIAFFLRAYFLLGLVAAGVALLQTAHGRFGLFGFMSGLLLSSGEYLEIGFRSASLFGEPSFAGRYFVHWLALSIAFYLVTGRARYAWCAALFLFTAYLAGSLAGFVVLLSFIGVFFLLQVRGRGVVLPPAVRVALVVAACLGLIAAMVMINGVLRVATPAIASNTLDRVDMIRLGIGGNFSVRLDSALSAIQVWLQSPVFGVGLGNTRLYIAQYYSETETLLRSYFGSDSMYTQVLAETGVVGLAGFLYLVVSLIRTPSAVRATQTRIVPPDSGLVVLRLLQIDFIAQAIGMINYSDLLSPHLWVIIALILALQQALTRPRPEPERAGAHRGPQLAPAVAADLP